MASAARALGRGVGSVSTVSSPSAACRVSLGAADSVDPARGGTHLSPREFHEAVEGAAQGRDDVVVVDVRSTYEHAIGHFEGAAPLLPSAPVCTGALRMAAQVLSRRR